LISPLSVASANKLVTSTHLTLLVSDIPVIVESSPETMQSLLEILFTSLVILLEPY
jgi:hypothetical protein